MAQKLQNITLGSPGFYGLNTELSPVELPPQFCAVANNCTIDSLGRLGARKGFNTQTTSVTGLGGEPIKRLFEWNNGTSVIFAVGNNKIFRVDTTVTTHDTLTEMDLPIGYTITGDDWDFANFNGEGYFFQAGHEPLLVNSTLNATDDLDTLDNQSPDVTPAAPEANIVHAAFGRLWAAGVVGSESTVYWSDTLIGDSWAIDPGSASGNINIETVWPNGHDDITAIATHNGKLIIFGKNSIVVYAGAEDPSTMALEDTISGTGCVARDSVQNTGEDIIFLSPTGLQLFSRATEEAYFPIANFSANVHTALIEDLNNETVGINSVYSHEENFYLLILEGQHFVYCADRHAQDQNTARITTWAGCPINCAMRCSNGVLHVGGLAGKGTYSGYQDDGASYRYEYLGPALTFDTPSNLKMLKRIRPVVIGTPGDSMTVSWIYGYGAEINTETVILEGVGTVSEYGIAEYGIAEYSIVTKVSSVALNATGSGSEVQLGISIDVDGNRFSLQQINVQALIGRLI